MFVVEPMTQEDVEQVGRVERRCFTNPWPLSAYRRELRMPDQNHYVVLREYRDDLGERPATGALSRNGSSAEPAREWLRPRIPFLNPGRREDPPTKPPIIGFAGMWVMFEEAHITTIGVLPEYRGRGLGELLLMNLIDEARRREATWVTLEVRVTNHSAQALYRKYGFTIQGRRPRYYSDNNEDAFIMWSESLKDPHYLERIETLRRGIERRRRFDAAPSREVDLLDDD